MREIVSPLSGIRSPFGQLRGTVFSPAVLFASGEEGAWYEPSTTTAFKSTTDLTPCGYGDGCGFLLDKSQGAGYSGGSFTGLGSELVDFSAGVVENSGGGEAWVYDALNDEWSIGSGSDTNDRVEWANIMEVGKTYLVSFSWTGLSGGAVRVAWPTDTTSHIDGSTSISGASGSQKVVITPASGQTSIWFRIKDAGGSVTFTSLSIRELPGNHATQGTASARPILARVPSGGRRNLLEKTEQFDDAYYTKTDASITVNAASAPNGTVTADKLVEGSGTVNPRVDRTVNSTGTHTFSVYAKAAERSFVRLFYFAQADAGAYFDLSAGTITSTQTGSFYVSSAISNAGDGWYRCSLTVSGASSTDNYGIGVSAADGQTSRTGDGTSGIYIWGAQLETGSTATAYQKVVSEYDVTEAGVTSLDYLAFDGSDDGMNVGTTSTFNFVHDGTGMEILAAVTPSDVANPDAFYTFLSNNSATANNIGFTIGFDDRASQSRNETLYFQVGRGVSGNSTFALATTDTITNFTSPTVFRFGYKEAESPEYFANENQVSVYSGDSVNAPSTSDATSVLSIGRIPAGTAAWDGKLFGLLMIDRLLATGEASNTEAYLANRSGVPLAELVSDTIYDRAISAILDRSGATIERRA